ncbi:IS481 family transposase [Parvibaculum sp.]|jgi:transposase InsO family protein|uniref:IS481 family transposase n=1 Tax=Parvibaculum sp. TaxID=2024848 RepID=UPI0032EEC334
MPWSEVSVVELRKEFVMLAGQPGAKVASLCRRFGISRKTGYKWLGRAAAGEMALSNRSRRPGSSPRRTAEEMEASVLAVREAHPCWGGRKIARRLHDLGWSDVPAPSTVTAILRRHGVALGQAVPAGPFQRFERARPNELWQMDFKGHFALASGRCHPLTVLDDCSRFNLCLAACGNERSETVQSHLRSAFRRYGLPDWIIADNGSPWGNGPDTPYTPLGVWLLRLGIGVSHSRPYHPQTLGKEERFHRTLKAELLAGPPFGDLRHCQTAFDRWRLVYNCERPHQALDMDVPATRYRPSERSFPEALPPIEYGSEHKVRRVQQLGWINFKGKAFRLPKAFAGYPVGLVPTTDDGLWHVIFASRHIAEIDLRNGSSKTVTHVSEHL